MELVLISYARKDKPNIKDLSISLEKRDKPPAGNVYGKIAKK